jgi:hypothetical protein
MTRKTTIQDPVKDDPTAPTDLKTVIVWTAVALCLILIAFGALYFFIDEIFDYLKQSPRY